MPFKKFLPVACVAAFGLLPGLVGAKLMTVYQGTLGDKIQVVLELEQDGAGGARTGRYFYRRYGVDIPLQGTPEALAEAVLLSDENPGTGDETPVFSDARTGKPRSVWRGHMANGRYVGTWVDVPGKKTLPFNLARVASYDPEASAPQGMEAASAAIAQVVSSRLISMAATPYDFLKMDVPLTQGRELVNGAVAYRMVTDPRTKFSYPRLSRHPNQAILEKTNRLLEQRHWAMSLNALECVSRSYLSRGPESGSLAGYDIEKINVDYLSPRLMSVVETGSIGCGGAGPNNHFDPYTLDLRRGEYFDFTRLLKGYKSGEDIPKTSEVFMDFVRRAAKQQGLVEDVTDLWPEYLYVHFKAPDRLAFDVSGVGYVLGSSLGTTMTLPFAALKPILKPGAEAYLYGAP